MQTTPDKRGLLRIRAAGRVAGFLLLVQTVVWLLMPRSGHARVNELMLAFGTQMMRYAEAGRQDRPRTLFVNGLALRFASGSTHREVEQVLDHFHAKCRRRNGRFFDQLRELQNGRLRTGGRRHGSLFDGVLRHHSMARSDKTERGFVGCLDTGDQRVAPGQLLKNARLFLRTGELSAVGELRYVMAERSQNGSHFVAFWTEGETNLYRAFPSEGDAPGRDPSYIPRPPRSRRLLSAWEKDRAPSLTLYASAGLDAASLHGFYRERLREMGWKLTETENAAPPVQGAPRTAANPESRALWAQRGTRTIALTSLTDSRNQGLAVLAEMP